MCNSIQSYSGIKKLYHGILDQVMLTDRFCYSIMSGRENSSRGGPNSSYPSMVCSATLHKRTGCKFQRFLKPVGPERAKNTPSSGTRESPLAE